VSAFVAYLGVAKYGSFIVKVSHVSTAVVATHCIAQIPPIKVSHVSTAVVATHCIAQIPSIKVSHVSTAAVATHCIAHITQIFFIIFHCYVL
jgi:hypothetical protein